MTQWHCSVKNCNSIATDGLFVFNVKEEWRDLNPFGWKLPAQQKQQLKICQLHFDPADICNFKGINKKQPFIRVGRKPVFIERNFQDFHHIEVEEIPIEDDNDLEDHKVQIITEPISKSFVDDIRSNSTMDGGCIIDLENLPFDPQKYKHSCDLCGGLFPVKGLLINHKIKTHKTEDKLFSCNFCGGFFSAEQHLAEHKGKTHTEKVKILTQYLCEICEKKFAFKDKLIKHKKNKHPQEFNRYSCEMCEQDFESNSNLIFHKKTTHITEKLYSCEVCETELTSKSTLIIHKKTHMPRVSEVLYSCDICDKDFASKIILTAHKKTHNDHKSFCCDICNKRFLTEGGLTNHKTVHLISQLKSGQTQIPLPRKDTRNDENYDCDMITEDSDDIQCLNKI